MDDAFHPRSLESLPDPLARELEEVCAAFEKACRGQVRPRLSDVLARWQHPQGRTELLKNLLLIEINERRVRGEQPTIEEYRAAFPDDSDAVSVAFGTPSAPSHASEQFGATNSPDTELAGQTHHMTQNQAVQPTHELPDATRFNSNVDVHSATSSAQVAPDGVEELGYGRFQIHRLHAEGGMGRVMVAFDKELRRQVAIKELKQVSLSQAEVQARFMNEAIITSQLEHPGIVPVYGRGEREDGRPYYVMKLIQGQPLSQAIDDLQHSPHAGNELRRRYSSILRRFADACNAVAFAHSRGVVHRDLKPANIMLGPFGETLVVDWGFAKRLAASDDAAARQVNSVDTNAIDVPWTSTGVSGTPGYMSPEQIQGQNDLIDARSDIYSLGATLYCILTGHPPVRGAYTKVVATVVSGAFPSPRELNDRIPPLLDSVCMTALATEPDNRYQNASSLAADIENSLEQQTVEPTQVALRALSDAIQRLDDANRLLTTSGAALVSGLSLDKHLFDLRRGLGQVQTEMGRLREA